MTSESVQRIPGESTVGDRPDPPPGGDHRHHMIAIEPEPGPSAAKGDDGLTPASPSTPAPPDYADRPT